MVLPPSDASDDRSNENDCESTSADIALPSTVGGQRPNLTEEDARAVHGLGFTLDPSNDPASLGKIRDYEILEIEGRGAMGVVLRASDPSLRRIVALKVMAAELSAAAGSRERFIREAQSSAPINHPNVVTVYSVGEHHDLPFLVMEFVEGKTLQDLIREQNKLSVETTLRIAHQITSGLAAAHSRGIVHRDVKPGNILIENGIQRVKIADFGLARVVLEASGLTSQGRTVGTPSYMSPEQVDGLEVDCRADLFSLGCVIYAMLTGHTPFRAGNTLAVLQAVSKKEHVPLDQVTDVPEALSQFVDRLLKKDPKERPASASQVLEELEQLMRTVGTPSRIANTANRERANAEIRRQRAQRIRLASLLAIIVALVAGSAWFAMDGSMTLPAKAVTAGLGALEHTSAKPFETHPSPAAPEKKLPQSLVVVGAHPEADYPTVAAALALPDLPLRIRVDADSDLDQLIHISGPRYSGLEITWNGSGNCTSSSGQPVVRVSNAQGVTLRGLRIATTATQHGIELIGNCSGLQIVDCTVTQPDGAQTAALYFVKNSGNSVDSPIIIRGVRVSGSQLPVAIISDGSIPFAHWRMEDCQFVGVDHQSGTAIVFEGPCAEVKLRRNRIARFGVAVSLSRVQGKFEVTSNTLQDVKHFFATRERLDDQSDLVVSENLLIGTQLGKLDGHLRPLAQETFDDNLRVGGEIVDWPGILKGNEKVSFASDQTDSPDFLRPVKLKSVQLASDQSKTFRYAGAMEPVDYVLELPSR